MTSGKQPYGRVRRMEGRDKKAGLRWTAGGILGIVFAAFCCAALSACGGDAAVDSGTDPIENGLAVTTWDEKTEGGVNEEYIDLSRVEGGGVVRIEEGGDYRLSGSASAMILIDAYEDEIVHLFLDGMSIGARGGPAIYVAGAAKLILTVSEGTSNTLVDSSRYSEEYADMDGCIYAVCDVTVNGSGQMKVYGYNGDAIHSKDRVKVVGAELDIWAKKDGIFGNDGVLIAGGRTTVQAEGNGVRTRNRSNGKGNIEMTGGRITVLAGKNGFSSVSSIYVLGGEYSVNSAREKFHAEDAVVLPEDGVEEPAEGIAK